MKSMKCNSISCGKSTIITFFGALAEFFFGLAHRTKNPNFLLRFRGQYSMN